MNNAGLLFFVLHCRICSYLLTLNSWHCLWHYL